MKSTVSEAWRMIAPRTDDPHGPVPPLLLSLTFLTGLVDAFSYLALGHVFVANMTGNVVFLAFALARAKGFSVASSLFALVAFSLGAVVGGRLVAGLSGNRGRLLAVATALEAIFIGGALVLAVATTLPGTGIGSRAGPEQYCLIVMLGLAMGIQNATARHLAVPDLTTTVLTLTITGIAADSHMAGGAGSRLGRRGLAVSAMFLGAVVGGLLVNGGRAAVSLVLALLVLTMVALAAAAMVSRANPSWGHAA